MGGAVVARDKTLHEQLVWWANCLGITGAPFDSYMTLRGLRTLHARLDHHARNAMALACWLHGVAFRLARKVRARNLSRRTAAGEALDRVPARPMEDLTWRELRQVLHEELGRLPEKNRLPILLCQDVISVWTYRHDWDAWNVKVMLAGALFGLGAAWAFAAFVPDSAIRLLVGLIGVSFVFNAWFRRPKLKARSRTLPSC